MTDTLLSNAYQEEEEEKTYAENIYKKKRNTH